MPAGLAIAGGTNYWAIVNSTFLQPDTAQGFTGIQNSDGSAAAPSYSFASAPGYGIFIIGGNVGYAGNGAAVFATISSTELSIKGGTLLSFSSGDPTITTGDLSLLRLGAASLQQGRSPSATPVAQVFTLGEASRPATDNNVGGASGTVRSGLGTGTGTASSLIFQTPTLAASGTGAQSYSTRMTVATAGITGTVPFIGPSSNSAASAFSFAGNPTFGFSFDSFFGPVAYGTGGLAMAFAGNTGFPMIVGSAGVITWADAALAAGGAGFSQDLGLGRNAAGVLEINSSASGTFRDVVARTYFVGATDLGLSRLTAANLRQGLAPSATPVAQLFTLGEASRGGTDNNVGGANGTIRSGLGTGTGAASSLIFQTPTLAASGTGVQSYGTRLTVATAGITMDIPNQGLRLNNQTTGAAAGVGTLTNAPASTNPTFWCPINIAGSVLFFPCW